MSAQVPHVPVLNAPQPNCDAELQRVCQQMNPERMRQHMEELEETEEEED